MRYLLPLLFVATFLDFQAFAEPRPGAAVQQVIRNGIAAGKSEEEIQQRLETLGLVPVEVQREENGEEAYSTHGGSEPDYAETPSRPPQQVGLPALSNLQSAREALEEEVRQGRLPKEAVEPLLAKIAPTVEKFADKLTAAGGNDKKIRDLLKDLPKFSLEYTPGEDGTQVVAQVVNGAKTEESPAEEATSSVPATVAARPSSQAYNQPAPPVVVLQSPGAPVAATTTTISKAPVGSGNWMAKVGETSDKISTGRRPLADAGRGVASTAGVGNASGSGTGMGAGKNSGTLAGTFAKGTSAVKEMVRSWIAAVKGEPTAETDERAPAAEGAPIESGFSLLKSPKLSASAAILRLPEAAWDSTRDAARAFADEWQIPEWLRMVGMLTAVATAMCLLWLIWRRRYSARRL